MADNLINQTAVEAQEIWSTAESTLVSEFTRLGTPQDMVDAASDLGGDECFDGEVFRMNVDGEMTGDVIGTTMAKQMADKYSDLRDRVVINLRSQDLLGESVYGAETGLLERNLTGNDVERGVAEMNMTACLRIAA